MIRNVTLLLALAVAGCVHALPTLSAPDTRAMTYNIRLDLVSDATNDWAHRQGLVAAVIKREAPDLLGLQEVLLRQKRDLEAALPDYAMVGVARDDGRETGEFSPLAYRRDRYELIEGGTFWLSPTPAVPAKGWDAAYPRVASWAILRDRASGERVRALNTHFDHVGEVARLESARQIVEWVRTGRDAGMPTVVLGDFNAMAGSEPYRVLASGLADARALSRTPPYGPPGTFNGFRIDANQPGAIDHAFVTPDWTVASYGVVTQHWGGRLPSDHYPVVVILRPTGSADRR